MPPGKPIKKPNPPKPGRGFTNADVARKAINKARGVGNSKTTLTPTKKKNAFGMSTTQTNSVVKAAIRKKREINIAKAAITAKGGKVSGTPANYRNIAKAAIAKKAAAKKAGLRAARKPGPGRM